MHTKKGELTLVLAVLLVIVAVGVVALFLGNGLTGAVVGINETTEVSLGIPIDEPIEEILEVNKTPILNETIEEPKLELTLPTPEPVIESPDEETLTEPIVEEPTTEPVEEIASILIQEPTEEINTLGNIGITAASAANSSQCGYVNGSITISSNASPGGIQQGCFEINSSNIIFECVGYTKINHSLGTGGAGINITNVQNVTIKNCVIEDSRFGLYGIYLINSSGVELRNNTIYSVGGSSVGIGADASSNHSRIIKNNVTSYSIASFAYNVELAGRWINFTNNSFTRIVTDGAYGVWVSGPFNRFERNYFEMNPRGAIALYITDNNNTFINNSILGNSSQTSGFRLDGGNNSLIENNSIIMTSTETEFTTRGIYLLNNANGNMFKNNYIIVNKSYEILDETTDDHINYLIYENSFGKIEWLNNGSLGLIHNLTINGTLGLNHSIYIANNTIAVNFSYFNIGRLNSTAEITITGIENKVNDIYFLHNFSNDDDFVIATNQSCLNTFCNQTAFGLLRYQFNVSFLGTFSINATTTFTNVGPNTSTILLNASTIVNHTNDDLDCWINGTDTEHTLLRAHWTWYNGSTQYSTGTTELRNGTFTKISTIPSLVTLRDDIWKCSVVLSDGLANETVYSNSSLNVSTYVCGDTISESKTLTREITECSGIGLNITGDNVTLNCNNYTISGSGNIGISANHQKNLTIKNCLVTNFSVGLNWFNVTNSLINASSFENLANGTTVLNSTNITITNNTFYNISERFLDLQQNEGITVTNNIISDGIGWGIYFMAGNRSSIHNNTLTRISHSYGLYIVLGTYTLNYSNNFTYNNISNNWNSTGVYPVSREGLLHLFEYNIVQNNSKGYEIGNFEYGNLTHETIIDNDEGIEMYIGNVVEAKVVHSTFTNNGLDIQADSGPNFGNLTVINSTLNRSRLSVAGTQYVYVKTLAYFNVTNNGVVLAEVPIDLYDVLGDLDTNVTTDSSGQARAYIETFYHNNKINYLISPTTVKIGKNNFTRNDSVIEFLNFTEKQVNATLNQIICDSSVLTSFQMGNNYQCDSAGFHFTKNDISLNGQNKNVTGSLSYFGINLTNVSGIVIRNLGIQNFSHGLYLQNTSNSRFYNLTLINNTRSLIFNSSNNNSIYDSVLNATGYALVVENDGGTNNSLVNVTIDPNNITVTGSATVYYRRYVDVNVTLPTKVALPNVAVNAFFNKTTTLDRGGTTGTNGIVRLELAEWKKNATDLYYITPHNISVSFTYQGFTFTNETSINLTKTNNAVVQLDLGLNCTGPSSGLEISTDTTFCPGTYTADGMNVTASHINVICDSTIVNRVDSDDGIMVKDQSNVSILNCDWSDHVTAVNIEGSNNITIAGHKGWASAFSCTDSKEITLNDSSWKYASWSNCNKSLVQKNVFSNPGNFWATTVTLTHDAIFKNNTFNNTYSAISSPTQGPFTNTTFYHNVFENIGGIYVDFNGWFAPNDEYNWNITVSGNPQGNNWDAYCDKGSDSDGDGYADIVSNAGGDYPFSRNQTTLFRPGDSITDWGPVYQACVTEVNLATGETTTSGSSDSAGGGGGAAAAASSGGTASASTGSGCGVNEHFEGTSCVCNKGYERISGKCVPDTGKKSLDGVSNLYGGDEYVPPSMFPKVANLPLFDAFGCIELSPQPILDISNNIFEKATAFPKSGKDFDFEYETEGKDINLYIWVNNQVGSVCTEFDIYVEDQKLQLSKRFNPVTDQFTFQNLDGNSYFLTQGMKIREECPSIIQQFKDGTAYITVNKLDKCV